MAMKLIKKMAEYKIFMRGDDRYAVQDANGKPVNGEEKVRILVEEDLIKVTLPSPKEEASECDGAANSGDGAKEVAAEAAEEAEASDDAGEPGPGVGSRHSMTTCQQHAHAHGRTRVVFSAGTTPK